MKPVEILLVEDDLAQATLFGVMLKMGSVTYNLKVISDGLEAEDYLFKRKAYKSVCSPDIVLVASFFFCPSMRVIDKWKDIRDAIGHGNYQS